MQYIINRKGEYLGPYSLAELQNYIQKGGVLPADMFRSVDAETWFSLPQMLGKLSITYSPISIWRSGKQLKIHRDAILPERCVKTNKPTKGQTLKRTLSWHSPFLYFLLFQPFLYLIVALCIRKTAIINIGVSNEILAQRKKAIFGSWVLGILGLALFVLGCSHSESSGAIIVLGIISIIAGFIWAALRATLVSAGRIDDQYVWIKGVNENYLAEFPDVNATSIPPPLPLSDGKNNFLTPPNQYEEVPPLVEQNFNLPPPLVIDQINQPDKLQASLNPISPLEGLRVGRKPYLKSLLTIFAIFLSVLLLGFIFYKYFRSTKLDLPSLAKAVRPSVAQIIIYDKGGNQIGTGSGFFISKDGRLITNYHVIEEAVSAVAKIETQAFFGVEGILAASPENDLAILKVKALGTVPLELGNSSSNEVGDRVAIIGSPLGLEGTLSEGIISAKRDANTVNELLQITAAISHGSSGSPVMNSEGKVIGVATLLSEEGQSVNFAVPIEQAKTLVNQIKSKEVPILLPGATKKTMTAGRDENNEISILQADIIQILKSFGVLESTIKKVDFDDQEALEKMATIVERDATDDISKKFVEKIHRLLKLKGSTNLSEIKHSANVPIETIPKKDGYPYAIKTSKAGIVKSPWAQEAPLIDVSTFPQNSPVECPHTGKIFIVP